jgi:electron transport complex protein RnfA
MEYVLIFITAIFINNVVLSQFLGICPFLGVSKKISTASGMGMAVTFVLTLATIVTYLIQHFVLDAFELQYLQTIVFILVIAALVQMVEIVLKKVSPALYQALGIFLPLIAVNCAILGASLFMQQREFANILEAIVYALPEIREILNAEIHAGCLGLAVQHNLAVVHVPVHLPGYPLPVSFTHISVPASPDLFRKPFPILAVRI